MQIQEFRPAPTDLRDFGFCPSKSNNAWVIPNESDGSILFNLKFWSPMSCSLNAQVLEVRLDSCVMLSHY